MDKEHIQGAIVGCKMLKVLYHEDEENIAMMDATISMLSEELDELNALEEPPFPLTESWTVQDDTY